MPGLVGFAHSDSHSAPSVLHRMQEMVTHESSYEVSPLFNDGRVAVASSQTPFRPVQKSPVSAEGIHLWLYGELYNRESLAREAGVHTEDDAALLLALYQQERDCSFLPRTDGFFCAVIYDTASQEVHLVCDRYGLHPLYWTVHDGQLAWSSELKAFLALPGFTPNIDELGLQQFLHIGYMLENRTWLNGVELVPTGTAVTYDLKSRTANKRRYWWWDQIRERGDATDEVEIAREMGEVFTDAVERRVRPNERVGLSLSGGLDSRAILAAMPDRDSPIHTVTVGQANCDDMRLAARAAAIKGAEHHPVALNEANWLTSRIPAVWWTDGHDLYHMHMLIARDTVRRLYDIEMNGFAGDAIMGGGYLNAYATARTSVEKRLAVAKYLAGHAAVGKADCRLELFDGIEEYSGLKTLDFYMLQNRVRRLIMGHTRYLRSVSAAQRMPFYDNRLVELSFSLPDGARSKTHIYSAMLRSAYPEFYNRLPWQKTSAPVGRCGPLWRAWGNTRRVLGRLARESRRFGPEVFNPRLTYDYDRWLRHGPALTFLPKLFGDRKAVFPDYAPREAALKEWERHLRGEDRSKVLCRYATLEIWLQQVLTGRYRPVPERRMPNLE